MRKEKVNSSFSIVLIFTLVLLLLPCIVFSAGKQEQKQEEKILNMYVAYGGPDIIARAFENATGIKIGYITMSSGEVLTRLQAEKSNPQTDVWFGGGSDAFIKARDMGLLVPYKSPNAATVSKKFRDKDGYWTGVSIVVVGFLVNEDRLKSKELKKPKTWLELADPSYKDELMASNPTTSGTAYTTVSGILQMMGEEKGWDFLDKMYMNIPFLEKSGSTPAKKVIAGEYSMGIVPDPHYSIIMNPDAPISAVFPSDGVLAWPSPVAIVKGAKHKKNAIKFIDWGFSTEGQQVLMKASPRIPTTNVKPLAGVPEMSKLNLIPYDLKKWGAERNRVIKKFMTRYPKY